MTGNLKQLVHCGNNSSDEDDLDLLALRSLITPHMKKKRGMHDDSALT